VCGGVGVGVGGVSEIYCANRITFSIYAAMIIYILDIMSYMNKNTGSSCTLLSPLPQPP